MKTGLISLAMLAITAVGATAADTNGVNLTPVPKQITVGTGELTLPASFEVSTAGLSDEMTREINKFVTAYNQATGSNVSAGTGASALFTVTVDSSIAPEGYSLTVTADGVNIKASAAAGLFYAFQTIKKILPPNVAVGVAAPGVYSLPLVTINDEPRYPWRGFELDVARHYFSVDQIKKMLDIMAVYKMNRFHWHLTDDQGWRFEMPKYPKLTTEAAAPLNAYWWDFDNGMRYTTNEMYGPFFFTVEEMKEVVEYARERHIEVCPEVDMPGHMQAAIAAYPEFSCTPDAPHPVRYYPGVSSDVLDISNPAVVQFTKDIIDELASIFTYEYIHIGGDECPTSAWANSASCQQFKQEHGLQSDRALQNWLTKELADYAREKHGRKLICWNEVLTADGADKEMVKNADILIYSWLGAGGANNPSKQAANLGLRSVWCSTSHYYLDYPQGSTEADPLGMGGVVNLERTYNATPDYEASKKELYYGVNGNLWTEYIAEPKHLEYMALPRLIAIAETGWSPQSKKNFNDFKARFNADTKMLDLGNYTYARHYVDNSASEIVYPEAGKFYRLITCASADANRRDRCIELVREGSPLIASNSAIAGKLWTNTQATAEADNYNWQYWTFEADPANSGKFAMVNRQAPNGSVSPAMEGSSVGASWNYDYDTKHYSFILGEHFSSDNGQYIYSVRSDENSGWWLNCAQAAQNLKVNNWNDPADGNGGLWLFSLEGYEDTNATTYPTLTPLQAGNYTFENLKPGLTNAFLCHQDALETSTARMAHWSNRVWTVIPVDFNAATNVQTVKLLNAATGAYIGAVSSNALNTVSEAEGYAGFQGIYNGGYEVTITTDANQAATIAIHRVANDSEAIVLEIDGKMLFAFGEESTAKPNGVNARQNASAQQGTTWKAKEVTVECAYWQIDCAGSQLYFRTEPVDATTELPVDNHVVKATTQGNSQGCLNSEFSLYILETEPTHFVMTYNIEDANGLKFTSVTDTVAKGELYTPAAPELNYLSNGTVAGATAFTAEADSTFTAVYSPFVGVLGVKAISDTPVTEVKEGETYVIYDSHSERHAFRYASGSNVYGMREVEGAAPTATWTLEAAPTAGQFYVRNLANGLYIQAVKSSVTATLGSEPYAFKFKYNTDHWTISNSKGSTMYWDGSDAANLPLVGWGSGNGHPYQFYTVTAGEPYYTITINEEDNEGNPLSSRSICVKPGSSYCFAAASSPVKALVSVTGNEGMDYITENKTITVTYANPQTSISEIETTKAPTSGIFDLQGRPVIKPAHGIYIVNGKKVVI